MVCCLNVVCLLCMICFVIGLAGVVQIFLGIYGSFLETNVIAINELLKTEQVDSYVLYVLLVFIGLGSLSLVFALFSIYGIARKNRSLSMFVAILWVFTMALNIAVCLVTLFYLFNILPNLKSSLIQTLRNSRTSIPMGLDVVQLNYKCCGIQNGSDYKSVKLNLLPVSCCAVPNCWNETDLNTKVFNNGTSQSTHNDGCFSFINQFVTIEIWVIFAVSAGSTVLQFLALTLMCILCERYRKFDQSPKFTLSPIKTEITTKEMGNVNNNNNCDIPDSSQNTEEAVEITQI